VKDFPRFVRVKLLHDPSIVRYFDAVGHVITARQVLLMTVKLDVACLKNSSLGKLILLINNKKAKQK
jgi:hypothetical protein